MASLSKKCPSCELRKEAIFFALATRSLSGLATYCKACVKKKRLKKIADGNCSHCLVKPPLKGMTKCRVCLVKANEGVRRFIKRAIQTGKCLRCLKRKASPKRRFCQECAAKRKARRRKAITKKLCGVCTIRPVKRDLTSCRSCLERCSYKMRSLKAVKIGLCARCRKEKALPNVTECLACSQKNKLRARLRNGLKSKSPKNKRILERYLGCSVEKFKNHIQKQWAKGMSWKNYGKNGWHIDHIRPFASFVLTTPNQLKKTSRYTNLQPLWDRDNLTKGTKWTRSFHLSDSV